jgi:hypothetical protein
LARNCDTEFNPQYHNKRERETEKEKERASAGRVGDRPTAALNLAY